jgi:ABC-2 type transport system ATP-binding protein
LQLSNKKDAIAAVKVIETSLKAKTTISGELLTVPMADPDRVTDLLVALRSAGVRLSEFSMQKPSLDEVFLAITGHAAEETKPEDTESTKKGAKK